MRTFISYASEECDVAERLALGLRNVGNQVFFDRDTLPAGGSFDDRIRNTVQRSHLFIFLISKDSLREGAYTLSELSVAEKRWPQPAGKILPVLLDDTPLELLPAYLRAVSVLQPRGDLVADVLDSVARLSRERRTALARRVALAGLSLLIAVGIWRIVSSHKNQPIIRDVGLTGVKAERESEPARFRFDLTVYNGSAERITIVDLDPTTDNPKVYLKPSSFECLEFEPGYKQRISVEAELHNDAKISSFKWRICCGFVSTLDLALASKDVDIEQFMKRFRKEACDSWRKWTTPH